MKIKLTVTGFSGSMRMLSSVTNLMLAIRECHKFYEIEALKVVDATSDLRNSHILKPIQEQQDD